MTKIAYKKEKKQVNIPKDILSNDIEVGKYCIYARHNSMYVGIVKKINNIMIRVIPYNRPKSSGYLVYPKDISIIDGEDALAYTLRNP